MDRCDVLIVGAGIAGIATALDLLDGDKHILLLDRDEEAAFGGLARESFGGMFFVDSPTQRRQGIRDSTELALRDWFSFAEFGADDRWPKAWAKAYVQRCTEDVYRWVSRHGVSFLPVVNWVERGEFRPGNSLPRFHVAWGTGRGIADALIAALRRHPNAPKLTIRFDQRVERLLVRAGRINGAAGVDEKSGVPFEVDAENVVVAAGGINGGDLSRVRQNWHRDWGQPPEVLLSGSHRFADGRLHDAAVAVGGVVTNLDRMWNYAAGVHHPRPRKPMHGLSLVPPRSALWLNWRGIRTAAFGVWLRHAAARHRYLFARAAIFLAANEHEDRVEGAGGLRRRAQSVDPRKTQARIPARYSFWQSLAGEGDADQLLRFRGREFA
jgi:uncharacterized protein